MILFLSINEYLRIIKHLKNYFQMKKKVQMKTIEKNLEENSITAESKQTKKK